MDELVFFFAAGLTRMRYSGIFARPASHE
jgi:hypothetical protein